MADGKWPRGDANGKWQVLIREEIAVHENLRRDFGPLRINKQPNQQPNK